MSKAPQAPRAPELSGSALTHSSPRTSNPKNTMPEASPMAQWIFRRAGGDSPVVRSAVRAPMNAARMAKRERTKRKPSTGRKHASRSQLGSTWLSSLSRSSHHLLLLTEKAESPSTEHLLQGRVGFCNVGLRETVTHHSPVRNPPNATARLAERVANDTQVDSGTFVLLRPGGVLN